MDSAPGIVPPLPAPPTLSLRHRADPVVRLFTGHLPALAVIAVVELVLLRAFLFSPRLPAGTDLGFVYSQLEYMRLHRIHGFSVWLSNPLGEVQQFSVYWLLANICWVVGHPVAVVKGAVVVCTAIAAVGMYGLAYWLTRSKLASLLAALGYVLAPISIGTWLLGHLDIGVAYAVGPLAVWALWAALRDGSPAAMVGLGLVGSAVYLITSGQGIFWLIPLVAITLLELARPAGRTPRRVVAQRLALTLSVALPVLVAGSAVQAIATLRGLHAPFTQSTGKVYMHDIAVHAKYSLPFVDNVLGVPLVSRYLAGTAQVGVSAFDALPYRVTAAALIALALTVLFTRHRRPALLLLGLTVSAWLLAAGPNGPIGPAYRQAFLHVPLFSFLRSPNRWLMVSSLCLALMLALAVAGLARRAAEAGRQGSRSSRRLATLGLICVVLLTSGDLVRGLPTFRPPSPYPSIYGQLRNDRTDWRIATVPFFQAWMDSIPSTGFETTIQADMGYASALWHGHSDLARGGWDPRAANLVAYIYELIKQGETHSLPKLLGALGVKYVAINPYAPTEVRDGQPAFMRRQNGLVLLARIGKVEMYGIADALPQAFVAARSCVAVGGLALLGDLADEPSYGFAKLMPVFADQALATGGPDGLRRELRASRCVVLAPGAEDELRVLLHAVATVDASFAGPITWTRAQVSPMLDLQADPADAVSVPAGSALTSRITAPRAGRYQLWVEALQAPGLSPLRMRVDGREAGVAPLASGVGSGMRWVRSRTLTLAAGSHRFGLTNLARAANHDVRIAKVALLPEAAVAGPLGLPAGTRVIRESGGSGPRALAGAQGGTSIVAGRWAPYDQPGYLSAAPSGTSGLALSVRKADRPYFTLATASAAGAVDPYRPLAFHFAGTGSGATYYLSVRFDRTGTLAAGFRFVDTTSAPRTLVFSPLQPSFVTAVPDWAHPSNLTLATADKSRLPRPIRIDGPFQLAGPDLRQSFSEDGRSGDPFAGGPEGRRALEPPTQLVDHRVRVSDAGGSGMLVLTQSFHPLWTITPAAASSAHTVALGFANGYRLERPVVGATIAFAGAHYGNIGFVASVVVWSLCLLLMGVLVLMRRGARQGLSAADRMLPDVAPPDLATVPMLKVPFADPGWRIAPLGEVPWTGLPERDVPGGEGEHEGSAAERADAGGAPPAHGG